MTVVGTAEIAINAGTAQFPSQMAAGVNPALAQTDTKMRTSAANAKKAWGSAASGIAGAFQSELGPVQGMLSGIGRSLKDHGAVAGTLLGAGSGALAAGVAGSALGSSEQAALQGLQQAVTNTGKSWADYSGKTEEAVKHGEDLAFSSKDTMNALTTLTVMLHSPEKALGSLTFAMNIARKNHIDLASAASLAGRANLGMARGLLPLGVNISADTKLVTAATSAQKAHASAVDTLKAKQRALRQEQDRLSGSAATSAAAASNAAASHAAAIASAVSSVSSAQAALANAKFQHGDASPQAAAAVDRLTAAEAHLAAARSATSSSTGPTVSEEIALSNARKAVADAQAKVTATTKAMQTANGDAKGAQDRLNNSVDQAKHNVQGLADAHVHTFGGQFDVWKTKIEDEAAMLGHQYGPALIAVGIGLQGLGAVYTTGAAMIDRYRGSQDLAKTAAAEATTVIDEETAALGENGLAGSLSAAETEMGGMRRSAGGFVGGMRGVTGAVAGVVGAIGTIAVGESEGKSGGSGNGATLTGALSGAAAGFLAFGPGGAVVGAVAGGLLGIGSYIHGLAHQINTVSAAWTDFESQMSSSVQSDKFGVGKQTKATVEQYLKNQNPGGLVALQQSGLKINDVMALLRQGPGGAANTKILEMLAKAQDKGKITADQYAAAFGALTSVLKAFEAIITANKALQSFDQPRHHRGHRAGGGDVAAGASYVVGEHGSEILQMGATGGHIYSHNGIGARGGDGAELTAQIRALRIDLLQVITAQHQTTRATQDVPHGITAELTRSGHHLRSPELASL